jgi:protein SCO1/2
MQKLMPLLLLFLLLGMRPPQAQAQGHDPLRDVGFDQKLGDSVPLDLQLVDESGQPRRLGELLGGKPAILDLGYYGCPMLCGQVENGLVDSLKGMDWTVGKQYRVLTVSIDPRERSPIAARHKERALSRYDRSVDAAGWRFLVGTPAEIVRLTGAVGFRAVYDRKLDQFAHPAGIVILTGQGKISSYLFGISFPSRAIERGLEKAAEERVGTPIDTILYLCFHYDPSTGRYSLQIVRLVQACGCASVLLLAGCVTLWLRRERRQHEHR